MSGLSRFKVILALIASLPWLAATGYSLESGDRFSILCLGDILLVNEAERRVIYSGEEYPFQKIQHELLKYDFVFANLEAPVTERGSPFSGKAYSFRMNPAISQCINKLKIDVVSISNNHLMDYGVPGLEDTLSYLQKQGIKYSGGGKNLTEARRPALLKYGATRMFIFSYCNRPPNQYYALEGRPGIAPIDTGMIKSDIAYHKTGNDVALVSLHWGIEQTHIPQSYQVRIAHEIIDSGADAIIGHHPHWPQGIEIYKGKPIIYSLGNLINGFYNPVERDNIGVALYFAGAKLEKIKVLPIAGQNRKIEFQPYLLAGDPAEKCLSLIQGLSKKLGTVMEIRNDAGFVPLNQNSVDISKINESAAAKSPARRPVPD
jgi:hypothetical protein